MLQTQARQFTLHVTLGLYSKGPSQNNLLTFIKWANQFEVKPHCLQFQLSPGDKVYNHLLKPTSALHRLTTIKQKGLQGTEGLLQLKTLPKLS